MLNQIILVGRLTKDPELISCDKKKRSVIDLAVSRGFKNQDGIYETDFIRCVLWNGVATSATEYCRKGDLVGIKGRLQTRKYEADEEIKYISEVIAEKVTYISKYNPEKVAE